MLYIRQLDVFINYIIVSCIASRKVKRSRQTHLYSDTYFFTYSTSVTPQPTAVVHTGNTIKMYRMKLRIKTTGKKSESGGDLCDT